MDFTAFNAYMVCTDDLKRYEAAGIDLGYEFHVKYPTYRGAYLCNIEELKITVDGKEIPKEAIRFGVNGKWFLLSEIPEMHKEYWFTGEKATVRVLDDGALEKGCHEVHMYMKHKIPYTGYFGNYLKIDSNCTQMLELK
jgi:hypothetical protein